MDCTTTGESRVLNAITQGSDPDERDGRVAMMHMLEIRGQVVPVDNVENCHYQLVRIMVLWDKQANGGQIDPVDFLVNGSSFSYPKPEHSDRFLMLSDTSYNCSGIYQVGNTVQANVHKVELTVEINLSTIYAGPNGVFTDISSGALILMTVGSEANLANAHQLEFQHRLHFTG